MLRRRRSTAKLYWLVERPRPRAYVRGVAHAAVNRLIVAVEASLAILLCVFLGAVAAALSHPRWPALSSIDDLTIRLTVARAVVNLSRCVPMCLLLGLTLAAIPRAQVWLFRFTMLSGVAIGYYQGYLPPLPRSADITRNATSLATLARHQLVVISAANAAPAAAIAAASLVVAAGAALIFYREAYALSTRTISLIPHRPRNHNRSAFFRVSLARRLTAVPVTAALIAISIWIVQNARPVLPGAHYGVVLFGYHESSVTGWIAITAIVALLICVPAPRGNRLLLVAILLAIAVYAVWPQAHLLRVPGWMPMAAPRSFWVLGAAYLLVTGLGFGAVAALLGWPAYVAPFARRLP